MIKNETKPYESPFTKEIQVELEDCVCATASGVLPAEIKKETEIEVEEYKEISNEISFD